MAIPFCHGQLSQDEIDQILFGFCNDTDLAISSTGILSVALNVYRLMHVIHQGHPYDVLSFVQEIDCMDKKDISMLCTSVVLLLTCIPEPMVNSKEDLFQSHLLCVMEWTLTIHLLLSLWNEFYLFQRTIFHLIFYLILLTLL